MGWAGLHRKAPGWKTPASDLWDPWAGEEPLRSSQHGVLTTILPLGKDSDKVQALRAWIPAEAEQVERDQREPYATLANPVLQDPNHKWEPGRLEGAKVLTRFPHPPVTAGLGGGLCEPSTRSALQAQARGARG